MSLVGLMLPHLKVGGLAVFHDASQDWLGVKRVTNELLEENFEIGGEVKRMRSLKNVILTRNIFYN